jgi:hypothetical protein
MSGMTFSESSQRRMAKNFVTICHLGIVEARAAKAAYYSVSYFSLMIEIRKYWEQFRATLD